MNRLNTQGILAVLGIFICSHAMSQDRLDMWEEPSHQLVYEDEELRVLDVRIVPGVLSEYHFHEHATVYVTIQDAVMNNQDFGEEWSRPQGREHLPTGTMRNSAYYVIKNQYHRVRNIDDVTFHLVGIVNLSQKQGHPDPHAYVDESVVNEWFHEHRITLDPGQTSAPVTYRNDVVVVQYEDGVSHVVEQGVEHGFKSKRGAFSIHQAMTDFQLVNAGSRTLELIVMEIIR